MTKDTFKVFTIKLAQELCKQGFRIVGTAPNFQKPWLYVYLFEDSPSLRAAVQRWMDRE